MFGKTFLLLMGVIAVGLLIDGFRTGGVWVKGSDPGRMFSLGARKAYKDEEPEFYRVSMFMYAVMLLTSVVVLLVAE